MAMREGGWKVGEWIVVTASAYHQEPLLAGEQVFGVVRLIGPNSDMCFEVVSPWAKAGGKVEVFRSLQVEDLVHVAPVEFIAWRVGDRVIVKQPPEQLWAQENENGDPVTGRHGTVVKMLREAISPGDAVVTVLLDADPANDADEEDWDCMPADLVPEKRKGQKGA